MGSFKIVPLFILMGSFKIVNPPKLIIVFSGEWHGRGFVPVRGRLLQAVKSTTYKNAIGQRKPVVCRKVGVTKDIFYINLLIG